MLTNLRLSLLLMLIIFFPTKSKAQIGCGFSCDAAHEKQANDQLNQYILQSQQNLGLPLYSTCSNIDKGEIKLPVVFHLIYPNGTPAGNSSNLTDAKVISLIDQINDIYAHVSGATFSNPLSGSDIDISFVLAKRTPTNNPTNGIIRHTTNLFQSVSMGTDTQMKTAYKWDPNRYINIYVVKDIVGASGYALFPSFHGTDRDGLVVDGDYASATLMTHELGHYLGLYHTFQGGCENGNCMESGDHVCDTPPKSAPGTAGGSCGAPANSCATDDDDLHDHNPFRPSALGDQVDGLENYMDYTGPCYGAFTQGQRERMRATVLSIRKSLINENIYPPTIKDIAVQKVVFPGSSLCHQTSSVKVQLKNNGKQVVANIPLTVEINGSAKKMINWVGPLGGGSTAEVNLGDIIFEDGINSIIVYTDWDQDQVSENNMACASTTYETPEKGDVIHADFESNMGIWSVANPDNLVSPSPFDLANCSEQGGKVLAYEAIKTGVGSSGTNDYIVSKTIDLTDAISAKIDYDYSHRYFYSNLETTLAFQVSDNCGESYTTLDSKTNFSLHTTANAKNYDPYYPKNCQDWETESIDLKDYLGKEVTLRFNISLEGSQGQNLFLDNFNIDIERNNLPDCNGDIGGEAKIDACGICAGGLTGLVPNATCTDCNSEINGTAAIDNCNVCAGGSTGIIPNTDCEDCNGVLNGTAAVDNCGVCAGGNTGIVPNTSCIDCAGVPGGLAFIDSCGVCAGGTTNEVPNATCTDCNGDVNGTAEIDNCGICAGGRTGIIVNATCMDCNSELNGTAEIDLCGVCAGGSTGIVPNATCTDCNGTINGTASVDNCGVCAGGTTGIVPNSTCTDCHGDLNGTASIDACGQCSGGATGVTPDNTCVSTTGCSPIEATPNVFCQPHSTVELKASSATGSCNNLKWYDQPENGTLLGQGCLFTTPGLTSSTTYYVEDEINTHNSSATKTTGYNFNGTGLSNMQPRWNDAYKTEFRANETTTLKAFDIKFSNCNNGQRIYVTLRDKTTNQYQTYDKNHTCNNNNPITLPVNFDLIAGHEYEVKLNNATNKEVVGYLNKSGNYSNYFSSEVTILRSGENYNGGFGPFFNWKLPSTCPRTEVNVFEHCLEICGNGIDDDGDGEIDEVCEDFVCSGRLLQSLGNTLNSISISPFSIDEMATYPFGLNALGYNPVDNKVYATIDQAGEFVRIDQTGNYERLGASIKPNGKPLRTWSADFGSNGTYYVQDVNDKAIYSLDVNTMLAVPLVYNVPSLADIAYNPINGRLYGIDGNKNIIEIDPQNGITKNLGRIKGIPGLLNGGGVGAVYFSPSGKLIAYGTLLTTNNQQDDLITVDVNTLQGTLISQDGFVTSNNDGASCPYSIEMTKTASVDNILPGDEFEYTINILNASALDLQGINFSDVLPKELSIQEIVSSDIGSPSSDITKQPDLLEFSNFTLPRGNSELVFKVKLKENNICEPYELPNQAVLSNLPATLGKTVVSDEPKTFAELDTTFVTVNANVAATLEAGTLSGTSGLICTGILQDTLRLTGSTGQISWEQSTDGIQWITFIGEMLNDSSIVVDEENEGIASIDYYYRAKLVSICDTQYNERQYTLAPLTARPQVTNSFYCQDEVAAAMSAVGTDLKWYEEIGGTFETTAPLPTTSSAGTKTYYVTQTLNNCESEPAAQDVIVTAVPLAPDLGPYEYCVNEPGNQLDLGTSHLVWYESMTDVTPTFDEPAISFDEALDTTFYVSYLINGCESEKGPLQVVVNAPAPPLGKDSTYCIGEQPAELTAIGTKVRWYTTPQSTSGTLAAPIPTTDAEGEQYFYAKQTVAGCKSDIDTVLIVVNPVPDRPVGIDTTYCLNDSAVPLNATGSELLWYSTPQLTNGEVDAFIPNTSIATTVSYYVTQTVEGCESEADTIDVLIKDLPESPVGEDTAYCVNEGATMVQASGTHLQWYLTPELTTVETIEPTPETSNDTLFNYYVTQTVDGCESLADTIQVRIKPIPLAPIGVDTSYCLHDNAVSVNATGNELLWYSTLPMTTGEVDAPIPNTNIATTISYYVTQTVEGCESEADTLNVTIKSLPDSPLVNDTAYCHHEEVDTLSAIGTNLMWYETAIATNGSNMAPRPDSSTVEITEYFVTQTIDGCESSKASIEVEILELPKASFGEADTLCPNDSISLVLDFMNGKAPYHLILGGENRDDILLANLSGPSFTWVDFVDGDFYIREVQDDNGCTAVNQDTIHIVKVEPLELIDPDDACLLSTFEFQASFTIHGGLAPYTINGHEDNNTVQVDEGVFNSQPIPYVNAGNYEFEVSDDSKCASNTKVKIEAPYDCGCPIKGVLVQGDTTICEGDSVEYFVELTNSSFLPFKVYFEYETSTGVLADSVINISTNGIHSIGYFSHTGVVRLTDLQDDFCSKTLTDSTVIFHHEQPVAQSIAIVSEQVCTGGTIALSTVIENGQQIEWQRLKAGIWVTVAVDTVFYTVLAVNETEILDTVYYRTRITDQCTSVFSDTVFVVIGAQPLLNPQEDLEVCKGDNVIIVLDRPEGDVYNWYTSLSGNVWVLAQSSTDEELETTILKTSKVKVEGVYEDEICPLTTTEFTIEAIDLPAYDHIETAPVCHGDIGKASLINVNGSVTWHLTNGEDISTITSSSLTENDLSTNQVPTTVNQDVSFEVYAQIEACGKTIITDTIVVTSFAYPVGNLTSEVSCEEGVSLTVEVQGTPQISTWEVSDGSTWDSFSAGLFFDDVKAGDEKYRVLLANALNNSCSTYTNEVLIDRDCPIYVPEAISPNGDDKNEVWKVRGLEQYEQFDLVVLNRFGLVVHHQANTYIPWDGTYQGNPVPVGTYYFIIKVEGKGDYTGSVTIMR